VTAGRKPPPFDIESDTNRAVVHRPLSDRELDTLIDRMKAQRSTGIRGQLTNAALGRLAELESLITLDIGGANQVTDAGLEHLAKMPQLQDLGLGGWDSPITDRGLESLRRLTELRRFHAVWTRTISDVGVANLTFCDRLESVNLMGSTTGDGAINALTGKPDLRYFKTGRLVTDAGLPLLLRFPAFRTWQGGEVELGLMAFDAKPADLRLDGPITSQGVKSLVGLDGLAGLSFFWHVSALTPAALEPLASLPNLAFLGCGGGLCTDAGFEALSRSRTIEYIWGRECPNLTGQGFATLARMPALRGLALSCKNLDDAALSLLPRFPRLRGLMPMDVDDEGFRHVGRCNGLEDLWCMYCRGTTDSATEHLSGLRLKTYYAGKTRITDRSLAILARMVSLERLEFWECAGLTNAGVAFLAGLPNLRELSIEGSPQVTGEAFAGFSANIRITHQ